MILSHYIKIIYVIFSAFLISMVSPNFINLDGYSSLSFIALVPLFLVYYQCQSYKEHFAYSVLFGLFFVIIAHYWLYFFEDFRWLTLGGTMLGISVELGMTTGFIFAMRRYSQTIRVLLIGCSWALSEYMKGIGDLAYPWSLISYAFYDHPFFNQIIDITGLSYLGFLLAISNATITELIIKPSLNPIKNLLLFIASLFIINFSYSTYHFLKTTPPTYQNLKLLMIQQNDNMWQNDKKSIKNHIMLVKEALNKEPSQDVDLIISGETITFSHPSRAYYKDEKTKKIVFLSDFIQEIGLPQLIGAPIKGTWGFYNATSLFNANGNILQSYGKRQLVPMAEGIPFIIEFSAVNKLFDKLGLYTGWERGKLPLVFKLNIKNGSSVYFSSPICYEDAFPKQTRDATLQGSQIFLNQSNDSWSRTVSSEKQHLAASVFRTIETRRPLVRTTNGGITAYIDEMGVIQKTLPAFTTATLFLNVPLYYNYITFYVKWGDYLIVIFMLAILFFAHKASIYSKTLY